MKSKVEDLVGKRKFSDLKNKKGSMTGVLHPGQDMNSSMTEVRDVSWEDPADNMIGNIGRSQMKENGIVFCPMCSGQPLKVARSHIIQSTNSDLVRQWCGLSHSQQIEHNTSLHLAFPKHCFRL